MKRLFHEMWNMGLAVENAVEAVFFGVMSILGIVLLPGLVLRPKIAAAFAEGMGTHIVLGYAFSLCFAGLMAFVCTTGYLVPIVRYLRPRSSFPLLLLGAGVLAGLIGGFVGRPTYERWALEESAKTVEWPDAVSGERG